MNVEISLEWAEKALKLKGMKDALDLVLKNKDKKDLTLGEKCFRAETNRAMAELGAYVAEQIDRQR